MKSLRAKLREMLLKDFPTDEQHKLNMEMFQHHTYSKEKAYEEGYRTAVHEILMRYEHSPVHDFHVTFGHPVAEVPRVPPLARRLLRVKLIVEEALEYAQASGVEVFVSSDAYESIVPLIRSGTELMFEESASLKPDLVEMADALGDLRVVTDGSNLECGFPQEEILYEVHRSNMTKLGADGKPVYREDNKIGKGPNFEPPEIEEILIEHGWEKE